MSIAKKQKEALRVLVVDDDEDFSSAVGELVKFHGCEVLVVHSGPEALAALNSFHPNLILLDIGMQGMDGYETARRIREQAEYSQLKLVALTGWGRQEDLMRSEQAGFDFHLVKPNGLMKLKEILCSGTLPD